MDFPSLVIWVLYLQVIEEKALQPISHFLRPEDNFSTFHVYVNIFSPTGRKKNSVQKSAQSDSAHMINLHTENMQKICGGKYSSERDFCVRKRISYLLPSGNSHQDAFLQLFYGDLVRRQQGWSSLCVVSELLMVTVTHWLHSTDEDYVLNFYRFVS